MGTKQMTDKKNVDEKIGEAELAAQIAAEAREAAAELEAEAEQAVEAVEQLTVDAAQKLCDEAEKNLEAKDKAFAKAEAARDQARIDHREAKVALNGVSPKPTTTQIIQAHLKRQAEKRKSGASPNPIDLVGQVGPSPFQQ